MSLVDTSFNVILLAAGEGSRLGRVPKSLLRISDDSLIERQVRALLGAGANKVVIVTGYFFLAIEADIERWRTDRIHVVRNLQPERGQQSSVLLGLQKLAELNASESDTPQKETTRPILIALVDQALMTTQDYQDSVMTFHQRPTTTTIVYPVVKGQRGNPVALSEQAFKAILESGLTCREYIDSHRDQVHRITSQNDHFIVDLDYPQDLEHFRQRTGLTLQLPQLD